MSNKSRVNWHEAASCAFQIELKDYSDFLEYIAEYVPGKNYYRILDISLTFLSCYYLRKLISHLKKERKLTVAKISPGVYYINKETFNTQIIVTKELPPEENLYIHCLTNKLQDIRRRRRLNIICQRSIS